MAKYQNIFFLLFFSLVVFVCSMFVCVCSSSLILTSVVLTGLSWGAVLTEREEQQEQSEDSNISCQSFPHLQKNLANSLCVTDGNEKYFKKNPCDCTQYCTISVT